MHNDLRIVPFVLVGAFLCSGCGKRIAEEPVTPTFSYEYETRYTVPATAPKSQTVQVEPNYKDSEMNFSFRSAVWLAKNLQTEEERYFCFFDDTNGKIVSQQDGQETPFTFEQGEQGTVFHLSGTNETLPVKIRWCGQDTVVFLWNDEFSENVTFYRENGSEPLNVFTNDQLCAMSQDDYAARNGIRPEKARVFYNLDEMIAVQLFATDGTATDTYDWYTVDRVTGEGYSTTRLKIALRAPSPDTSQPASTATQPASETLPPTEPPTAAPTETTPLPTVGQLITDTLPPLEVPSEALPENTVPEGMEGMYEGMEGMPSENVLP